MEKTRFFPASPTAAHDSGLAANTAGSADLHNKWRKFLLEKYLFTRVIVH